LSNRDPIRARGDAHASRWTALLVVGALAAGVILSEAGFRVAKRFVCTTAGSKLFEPHPLYGWRHEPHGAGWAQGCVAREFEWRTFSRMNGDGLRDHDYPPRKRPGVVRILLLGDSFVEGMQVPLESTFAKRLEAKLLADGRDVEVVNAGVSGFGTDNELLFFEVEGERYEPDLVVLGFTAFNDVIENSRPLYERFYADSPDGPPPKAHFELARDGKLELDARDARRNFEELAARPAGLVGGVWAALERHLHVVRLVESALRPPLPPEATRTAHETLLGVFETESAPAWDDAWALTAALVRRLEAEVAGRGAALAAAIIPPREAVSAAAWRRLQDLMPESAPRPRDPDRPARLAREMFARARIPELDLGPALRAHFAATGRTGYFDWDIHLTEDGHEVVAEALHPFVTRLLDARARALGGDGR
jgi:lysophospholipase L1-like esterase